MRKINKNTKVEFVTESRVTGNSSSAIVEAGQLFNFDGFSMELSKEQKEFLGSLNHKDFKEIPYDMLDMTTRQNFICYIKRV